MNSSPIFFFFFFDVPVILLSILVTGPNFMSMSLLVLELSQFSFKKDSPEIQKFEILLSEFWPISSDWGELRIPNLARIFLMKCYWMQQNFGVAFFTVLELLRENQKGLKLLPLPPRLGISEIQNISRKNSEEKEWLYYQENVTS